MRRILSLLRHAKSAWDQPGLPDHARGLNARGRRAAPAMAQAMIARGIRPDLVLVSDAERTRQTLALMQLAFAEAEIRIEPKLYLAEPAEILAQLIAHDPAGARGHILVLGHNPGLETLTQLLAGNRQDPATRMAAAHFPTAALALLEGEAATWRDLRVGGARLSLFLRPVDLAGLAGAAGGLANGDD